MRAGGRALAVANLFALALLPILGAAQSTPPSGEALPVLKHTLENGMTILVLPRRGAPTVSFVVEFAVGGVNEVRGTTGIAHLLEHLLFKGTTTIGTTDVEAERALFRVMDAIHDTILAELVAPSGPDARRVDSLNKRIGELEREARSFVVPNEFDQILTRNGARGLNATTTNDATSYFVELPANRAKLWWTLEADRMRNPVFREFYAERDVVAEERRTRVETSGAGLLYEAHLAAAYQSHPYGVPVVGQMSDIQSLGRGAVESYYRRYYGPNNAVVAVVGDIDPDSAVAWSELLFSPIPPGEAPSPVLAVEPEQRGERRVEIRFDAEPHLKVGWHTVNVFHPDAAPLAVLASLLTGGRTSRLYRRLVEGDRLATFVSSGTVPGSRYPALLTIDALPRWPHTTDDLETAIDEEIELLRSEGPTEQELQRVRNQLEASDVRRLTSNLGLAFQLAGSQALFGDWRTTFRLTSRLRRVSSADVQRVVRRYLIDTNRTVAVLLRDQAGGTR